MKTKIQNLFIALAWLALPALVQAQFTFTINNGAVTITGYYSNGPRVVVIPATINGYPVTTIGNYAFDNSSITSVTIPNSVTNIGPYAFDYCHNLTSVTIGNSVTSIGDYAFAQCTSLTSVTIPNSVTSIGNGAFGVCTSLTRVTIGNSVTSIGDEAFFYCTSLTRVTIPNSVTNIGDSAFDYCASLTSVTIPNSVTSIGGEAFEACYGLTNIAVNAANPYYASVSGVLFDKSLHTLLQFPGGLAGSYAIPNSVTSIGVEAFDGCSGLTSVTIPNSVTSIGEIAFANCPGLMSVTIPNSVTSIGYEAFNNCSGLHQAYFQGNAPLVDGAAGSADSTVFAGETGTAYYLPGATGWGSTFGYWPTALWYQPAPVILGGSGLGVQGNHFGFTISWATNASVVVEAATNLANPVWIPMSTNPLVNGTNAFTDPSWTNYPQRFYRVASAFTVGGTLTGLPAGDTVTLQDNGSDNLTLSTNGTFTFPTALPNGHTYSVTGSGTGGGTLTTYTTYTIRANGSGTISGANVTNVAVRWTPRPVLTGDMALDMLNAAVADGTANGGVPGVMLTENGGPFRVTAAGIYSSNVALVYQGWARTATTVGSNSCSSTTFPSNTGVIQFGTALACGGQDQYGY